MMTVKIALVAVNILGALSALVAAWFWFKASQTKLPEIDAATGRPTAPVSMLGMTKDIVDAARLNRTAACWSGAAAALGAVSLLLSSI
ncbi:hypothetical protein AYM40_09795 [Paraburkholderia phytofirmans OLGA172]|uniref:Uncharacterized protein n=1 Tax=Paraburkholderia phytofirmans OLGA172 TaxID=1417228 RepID=A0A167VY91_9BURK|nr:hypothetical protein AYM40_09795 [Paraburkholderia phytofirmans OLGA172]